MNCVSVSVSVSVLCLFVCGELRACVCARAYVMLPVSASVYLHSE